MDEKQFDLAEMESILHDNICDAGPTVTDVYQSIYRIHKITVGRGEGYVAHTLEKNQEHLEDLGNVFQASLTNEREIRARQMDAFKYGADDIQSGNRE